MTNAIAAHFAWLRTVLHDYVPCNCYAWRLWRPCVDKDWCLRATLNRHLSFMYQDVRAELAVSATRTKGGE